MDKFLVFDFYDYKRFLRFEIERLGKKTKGLQIAISKHILCQPSYLSQVLNGKPQLTMEQCLRLCDFFKYTKQEVKYFTILVQYSRAGTSELKFFFKEQLDEIREQRTHLKKRLESSDGVPTEMQHTYYSTWFYSAVHVLLSIPSFQYPQIISQHLRLPLESIIEVITFLENAGLIVKTKEGFKHTQKRLHLSRDSKFIQRHHINWRSQALQSVEKNLAQDLHYSNVIAISKADFGKIKEIFIRAIEHGREIIKPSLEESAYVMIVDIFEL